MDFQQLVRRVFRYWLCFMLEVGGNGDNLFYIVVKFNNSVLLKLLYFCVECFDEILIDKFFIFYFQVVKNFSGNILLYEVLGVSNFSIVLKLIKIWESVVLVMNNVGEIFFFQILIGIFKILFFFINWSN